MADHACNIRAERALVQPALGARLETYRVTCLACGWMDKAATHESAEQLAERHEQMPHRT